MRRICQLFTFLGAGLSFLPLAFQFGHNFEYEYATVLSWVILIILPVVGFVLPLPWVRQLSDPKPPPPTLAFRLWSAIGDGLWITTALGSIFFAGGLAFFNDLCACSGRGYVFWMLIQTVPAACLAYALSFLMIKERSKNRPVALLAGLWILVFTFTLVIYGSLLWFLPQKRLSSIFLGFLHGPIYDEWIPVDHGVVVHRVAAVIITIVTVVAYNQRVSLRRLAVCVAAFVAAFSSYGWTFPSGGHGTRALQTLLPMEKRIGFLVFHYLDKNDGSYSQRLRVFIKEALFHAEDLTKILGVSHPKDIHIYIYPSIHEKKLWFGGGSTDVTDVWTPSIHVTADEAPHPTLRHELVHAIASQFGWYGIGFHPNMAITEGLAMALAPSGSARDMHELAAMLIYEKMVKDPEVLFSPFGFWAEAGNRSYTIAGSLLTFLLERVGPEAVRDLYAGRIDVSALHAQIEAWKEFLKSEHDPRWRIQTEALFRYPGVLRSKCPHTKADYAQFDRDSPYVRWRQPVGWDPGDITEWRTEFDPNDRSSQLDLWFKRIREQMKQPQQSSLATETWLGVVRNAQRREKDRQTLEDIELAVLESDLLAALGQREQSLKLLQTLLDSFEQKRPGEGMERQVAARLLVEGSEILEEEVLLWRRYLAGWSPLPTMPSKSHWIFSYLRFRKGVESEFDFSAVTAETNARFKQLFLRESRHVLAARSLNRERYDRAADLYANLEQDAHGSAKAYYQTMQRLAKSSYSQSEK